MRNQSNFYCGHPYTTWSDEGESRGEGVHEMTMIDHEREGFRNDHVVRWIDFFVLDQKTGIYVLHAYKFLE